MLRTCGPRAHVDLAHIEHAPYGAYRAENSAKIGRAPGYTESGQAAMPSRTSAETL